MTFLLTAQKHSGDSRKERRQIHLLGSDWVTGREEDAPLIPGTDALDPTSEKVGRVRRRPRDGRLDDDRQLDNCLRHWLLRRIAVAHGKAQLRRCESKVRIWLGAPTQLSFYIQGFKGFTSGFSLQCIPRRPFLSFLFGLRFAISVLSHSLQNPYRAL